MLIQRYMTALINSYERLNYWPRNQNATITILEKCCILQADGALSSYIFQISDNGGWLAHLLISKSSKLGGNESSQIRQSWRSSSGPSWKFGNVGVLTAWEVFRNFCLQPQELQHSGWSKSSVLAGHGFKSSFKKGPHIDVTLLVMLGCAAWCKTIVISPELVQIESMAVKSFRCRSSLFENGFCFLVVANLMPVDLDLASKLRPQPEDSSLWSKD